MAIESKRYEMQVSFVLILSIERQKHLPFLDGQRGNGQSPLQEMTSGNSLD